MTQADFTRYLWKLRPESFYSDCLRILPKVGRVKEFVINAHQKIIQEAVDRQRSCGKPVRIIILKPRQTGISTVSAANLFHSIRFGSGVGMVVSKDLDSAEHLFGIIQRFYYYLPAGEKEVLQTIASNRKELKFAEPHGGRILVETARKDTAGHSFTVRHLHLSEVSRWENVNDDTIAGLMNSVPREPETSIVIESVANGMSGWFYQKWYANDDFEKVFLPWYEHDEYQKELPIDVGLYTQGLDDKERRLHSEGRTLEQIEWRRWATKNNCQGDPEKFKEQYPATADEAFLSTGNTFFHIPSLAEMRPQTGLRCDIRLFEHPRLHTRDIQAIPNERGLWTVWKRPESGRDFVVGADIAEGVEIDGAPAEDRRDYSAADILDRHTGEQVAQFHAQVTPDEFGRQLALAGEWYNWAYVNPEMNAGYGAHLVDTMVNEKYPEHLFYRRDDNNIGWKTTKVNKKPLLSALDMAIRDKELVINSAETVRELRSFIVKPDGKLEGGAGSKDDRVLSLAIAYRTLITAPAGRFDHTESQKPVHYLPYKNIYSRRAVRTYAQ